MGTSGERAPVRQQTCPSPSNIIVKFMEKNLDMAKPHYGKHIYCQSLDPSLCSTITRRTYTHVPVSLCCQHKYIFSHLVAQ